MKLNPMEIQLRTNLYKAFECLQGLGFSRKRFRSTAHEYEVFYYSSVRGQAVRLTIERQWGYRYLFVLFLERESQAGDWSPLYYLDRWLQQRGWSQSATKALFESETPIQNMSDQEQLAFLGKAANVVCKYIPEIFRKG